MKKIVLLQLIAIFISIITFNFFGRNFEALNSFVFSFLSYWVTLIILSGIIFIKDEQVGKNIKTYFKSVENIPMGVLSFLPVTAVFFVVFINSLPNLSLNIVTVIFLIGIINGIVEELFWRGIPLAKFEQSKIGLTISVILFSLFHFVFLFLPLSYHGGAVNLVGGSAFMGVLWMISTRYSRSLYFSIFAHILVNGFAFSGLFLDNNLIG